MRDDAGRKLYSPLEALGIAAKAVMTMPYLSRAEKTGEMTAAFKERLMLAVTEVNGCRMCSYAHAKIALEAGLSTDEIAEMCAGRTQDVPPEEMYAVLFAQHYADARGRPSKKAWADMVKFYGHTRALAILGAVRGIMLGNAYGIPLGSFMGRMRGKRAAIDLRSSLGYELLMLLTAPVVIPFALLGAFVARLIRIPVAP